MIEMDKYIDLVDYLKKETRDDFYLELEEIEKIIGQPLPKSAYNYPAYWFPSDTHYSANLIAECGFRISTDLKNKRLRLIRDGVAVNKPQVSSDKPKRARTYQRKENVPEPSEEQVEFWLHRWDELEDYTAQEDAIDRLFHGEFAKNDNLQNILIKCSVLNDFYSTNIFRIYPVAKHILSLNIDDRLKKGDPSLVDDIAKVSINNKDKYFYSFASKYCSHHNQLDFPIYDSYVHKVLKYYRNVDRFFIFDENDLKVYSKFKDILIQFRSFYKLDKYNLKELDKYLWQFGKEYFPNNY